MNGLHIMTSASGFIVPEIEYVYFPFLLPNILTVIETLTHSPPVSDGNCAES